MKLVQIARLGTFAAAMACGVAQANLITNGSFEDDAQAPGTWQIYPNLTGWVGGPAGIELRNNVAGAAYDGVNYVELDSTENSLMYQSVGTMLSQLYTLSFAYSAREGVSLASNGIEVFWNDVSQGVFSALGAPSGHSWQVFNLPVFGLSPQSTLRFQAVGNSDSFGGSLDAVTLTAAIPEPETYALMLAGLGVVAFVARRRRPNRG